jgi:hypothetical protein
MINSGSIQKTDVSSHLLRDLDELIALAKRRILRIEAERNREIERGITRLLRSNVHSDVVGDRLVDRLDEVVRIAENRLSRLEDQRAAVLLQSIDELFPEAEV